MKNRVIHQNAKVVNLQPETMNHATSEACECRARPCGAVTKYASLALLLCMSAVAASPPALAQAPAEPWGGHYKTIPIQGNTPEQALQESQAGATLPMWTTTVQTRNWFFQNNFNVQTLGAAPSSNTTTYIPTYLIPMILQFLDQNNNVVATFDPTQSPCGNAGVAAVTAATQSPLFNNSGPFMWGNPTKVNFGTTQYIDALQRASWYPSDQVDQNWHTSFGTPQKGVVVTGSVVIPIPWSTVPGHNWSLLSTNSGCGLLGLVNESDLNTTVQGFVSYLYHHYGIGGPTALPVVLLSDVASFTLDKNNNPVCCTLGYHSAYGSPLQVYAEAMFDQTQNFQGSSDITPLSHELAEAVNDPTTANWTPSWGHVGQVSGCQTNLEVGDPLSGTQYPAITLNSYIYHPQELAMVPWFYGISNGLGWYSTNGTFKSPASLCFTFNPWFELTSAIPTPAE